MPTPPRLALVAACLFCSGCCGLVFQIAWMRELRLVFGATTAATGAVLAIFMGGLGIGNALLGRRADRTSNPLAMYGLLEVGIAITVAASPWLVSALRAIYIGLGGVASLGTPQAILVRLLFSCVVLGIPTFLMGGTLPAAVRAVTSHQDAKRHALATLYGVNTLGAMLGALIATFFMLEHFGTRATLWIACALNLTVGVCAWVYSRRVSEHTFADPLETAPSGGARPALVYLAAGLLGFTFFLMELVWYRMLGPILGGTTFTFGLILAAALLGIGLGGTAYNLVFRKLRPSWSAFSLTCALEALAIAIPYAIGDRIAVAVSQQVEQDINSFSRLVMGWSEVVLLVVLPAALVSGLQFPLLLGLLGDGRKDVGRQLGNAYACNTVGSILGSLAGGFGAIPLLSALGAWKLVVLLLAGVACAAQWGSHRAESRKASLFAVVGVCCLALICLLQTGPTSAWRHSGVGAGRSTLTSYDDNSVRDWLNARRRELVWEADGVESSVGIMRVDGLSFIVNGKADGNSIADSPTQVGMAILGAVLHHEPRTALVIGLGTGETCGWLADMRQMERVDVVELEPVIDRMAELCADVNRNALENPRITRIYNDGREAVLTANVQYDLILSEPSNPYRAGVAALFTREFYRSVRQRLNEDGLFLQWVQAYEVDRATLETVLATLHAEFDYVEIWQGRPSDLLVVCSNGPPDYTTSGLRERIADGVVQEALRSAWQVHDLEGFLAHFLANHNFTRELVLEKTIPLNTDNQTILEYAFARSMGTEYSFSSEQLRLEVAAQGAHRPTSLGEDFDWQNIEERLLEFNALLGGQLLARQHFTARQRSYVDALAAYLDRECEQALGLWLPSENESPSYVELVMLAHCHAELGREQALDFATQLESFSPRDADAVRALYAWRTSSPNTVALLEKAIQQLQQDPWGIGILWNRVFDAITELAYADPEGAQRCYDFLEAPITAHRYHERRLMARFEASQRLGPTAIVQALAPFEPHVPWWEPLLESRKVIYQQTDHPLKVRAARDLTTFRNKARTEP